MTITVTQLNQYIKRIIEGDVHLADLAVTGEISNFKRHSSGHCYLTLKDDRSAVRAVMFRGSAEKLRFSPENGMKVIASGRVSVFERDGQYQLYLNSMQPDGVGDLYVAYEQLKARLEQEGLFAQSRKKPIPRFPKTVGVVTSPTGAAVRDIINVITRRYPLAEVILCPVLVQGENAAGQIANAIAHLNQHNMADVIIAGRGGGSIEDLWAFNEQAVAYAIANSNIPVISAVGHETDVTIADFVADLRAPTPSAAAELAVPSMVDLYAYLKQQYSRMLHALRRSLEGKKNILDRFALKEPADVIGQHRMRTDHLFQQLENRVSALMEQKKKSLSVALAQLDAMSPLNVLSRGYSVAQTERGVVRSVDDVTKDDVVSLRVSDGTIACIVSE